MQTPDRKTFLPKWVCAILITAPRVCRAVLAEWRPYGAHAVARLWSDT